MKSTLADYKATINSLKKGLGKAPVKRKDVVVTVGVTFTCL
jgi:hypothetical protein